MRNHIRLMTLFLLVVALDLSGAARTAWGQERVRHLSLTFHGAAGKVGGSCFLLDADGEKVLLDCGLAFDEEGDDGGVKGDTTSFPFDPKSISAVVVSHIHLDHAGALPLLVKRGFRGRIHATRVTRQLAAIALQSCYRYGDFGVEPFYTSASSGRRSSAVHSRDDCDAGARMKARTTFQAHRSALAAQHQHMCRTCLRLELDDVMRLFVEHPYHVSFSITSHLTAVLQPTGHLPGSAMTTVIMQRASGKYRVIWSGDYGGGTHPFLPAPETVGEGQVLLVESTYGGNTDPERDPAPAFIAAVASALKQGRRVLVPAFTLDRSQRVLAALARGRREGGLPEVPVYITSRTIDAFTRAYQGFSRDRATYGESFNAAFFDDPFRGLSWRMLRSKSIPQGPSVVVASSADGRYGACAALLEPYVTDPRAAIIKVGWASPSSPMGRLYAASQKGAREVELTSTQRVSLQASLAAVSLSGHGHASTVARLATGCRGLQRLFLVHGEPDGLARFAAYLRTLLPRSVQVRIPAMGERVELF